MARITNLYVDQGSQYTKPLIARDGEGTPIDLTDYAIYAHARKSPTTSKFYEFTVEKGDQLSEPGSYFLSMSPDVSSSMPHGKYVYDVYIVQNGGSPIRVSEGLVFISPQVTIIPLPVPEEPTGE